jgi:uncharacterized protein YjbJ (UPF0337 family)
MNWNQMEGSWKQFKGSAKARWGALTESRLDVVAGKRDQRAGIIQEIRGTAQEAEARQIANGLKDPVEKKDLRDLQ